MSKLFSKIFKHKFISAIIFFAVVVCGFFGYKKLVKKENLAKYVLAAVEKGAITVSISGSGQIAASNQIDIKAKVSGEITQVNVKNGQAVKEGDLLVKINSRDAQKNVRDAQLAYDIANADLQELISPADELAILQAENSVKTAQANLEKLLAPADEFSLLQAEKSLEDAKNNLEDLKYAQNKKYQDALAAKEKSEQNLKKSYEDAYVAISNIFLELPESVADIRDIIYSYEISESEYSVPSRSKNTTALLNTVFEQDYYDLEDFVKIAEENYENARSKFEENFKNYKDVGRYSESDVLDTLLDETLQTIKAFSDAVKSEMNMLDFWVVCRNKNDQKIFEKVSEHQNQLKTHTSKTNGYLSSVNSANNSVGDNAENIKNCEEDILDLERSFPSEISKAEWAIKEKEESLRKLNEGAQEREIEAAEIILEEKKAAYEKLEAGADSLDIRMKKNSVRQKADALADAKQALSDCLVKASFDGVIAEISVGKGDEISTGNVLVSLVSNQKVAEISLNEIDASKVKLGQKTIATFDAIENLSITGEVAEIDMVGSVNQSVVSYGVKIIFGMDDERVKSGMSASISIITEIKQNVLMAPNAAVKTAGENFYIQTPNEDTSADLMAAAASGISLKNTPLQKIIQTGIANDSYTEIIGDVKEGDKIIVRAVSTSSSANQTQQTQGQSLFQMGGASGGNFRAR
ncbi:MAG: efflux RND transporter periplasmic adaptor subunit [bacterium]